MRRQNTCNKETKEVRSETELDETKVGEAAREGVEQVLLAEEVEREASH